MSLGPCEYGPSHRSRPPLPVPQLFLSQRPVTSGHHWPVKLVEFLKQNTGEVALEQEEGWFPASRLPLSGCC